MINNFLMVGKLLNYTKTTYSTKPAIKLTIQVQNPITKIYNNHTIYYVGPETDFSNINTLAVKGVIDTNDVDTFLIADRLTFITLKNNTEDSNENL